MIRVRVEGAERTVRAFKSLGLKTRDLSAAFARIGGAIVADAVSITPVLSGALADNIRAGKAKTRATVSAGGYGVLYAGVQNYGGYQGITPKYFLNIALESNEASAGNEIHNEMQTLIKQVGLG